MFIPNNDLYEKMSEPFPTAADAQKAQEKFAKAVEKLREKYRIAEVVLITQVYCDNAGEAAASRSYLTKGDHAISIKLAHETSLKLSMDLINALIEKGNFQKSENGS